MANKRDEALIRICSIRDALEKEVKFLFESYLESFKEDNNINSIFSSTKDFCERDYFELSEIYKNLNDFIKHF